MATAAGAAGSAVVAFVVETAFAVVAVLEAPEPPVVETSILLVLADWPAWTEEGFVVQTALIESQPFVALAVFALLLRREVMVAMFVVLVE